MLKVVGASWLQTRISTYIIVAVAIIGVGAIILSEFGQRYYFKSFKAFLIIK
ncbi:GSCOCG00012942001-RA-CDS [Cotesia congregata]|nr:GSCOCG00012942001-RA-CDS [Cotesia congregata]